MLVLSTERLCSLNMSLRRRLVSPMCIVNGYVGGEKRGRTIRQQTGMEGEALVPKMYRTMGTSHFLGVPNSTWCRHGMQSRGRYITRDLLDSL